MADVVDPRWFSAALLELADGVREVAGAGEKLCTGCGVLRPRSDFGRDRRHSDGLQSHCRPCKAAAQRAYAAAPEIRVRDRATARARRESEVVRAAIRERSRRWRRENPGKVRELTRSYRARFPARKRAYETVAAALSSGRLIRRPCARCGSEHSQAHHPHGYDGSLALDVLWLCSFCHHREHHP